MKSDIDHKEIYFVPMTVSYDRIIEDQNFDFLTEQYKKAGKTKKALLTFLIDIPFLFLYSSPPYMQKKAAVKVNFGKPHPLADFAGKKRDEISKELQKEASYLWEVFPTSLVSYSVMQEVMQKGNSIPFSSLEKRVQDNADFLKYSPIPAKTGKILPTPEENIEYFISHFDQPWRRDVSCKNGNLAVNKTSTIEKNANLIRHLMEPGKYL
jgi:hypothetical protein